MRKAAFLPVKFLGARRSEEISAQALLSYIDKHFCAKIVVAAHETAKLLAGDNEGSPQCQPICKTCKPAD